MSERGERALEIITSIRRIVGPGLLNQVNELDGLVRELDQIPATTPTTTGSGFTQARSVESDSEGEHTPGRPG